MRNILPFIGSIFICGFSLAFWGCGSGEDDQQESVSSESNVQVFDCSGAAQLSPEQVEQLEEESNEGSVEAAEKLAVIGNCNTVTTQDDHSTSDDDVTTNIGEEEQ